LEFSIAEWTVLLITIAFGILVILFLIQAVIRKRYAWSFLISLVFGLLAGLAAIFGEVVFSGNTSLQFFSRSLHLNLYGFHFFFFYIFFERLISKKINSIRLSIMIALLLTQTIGLWLVFYNGINGFNTDIAWVLADIGYWTPALFVYLGLGVPIFIKTYLYTKEIRPIILSAALILVGFGFIISMLNDIYFILGVFGSPATAPDILTEISEIANIFPSIGVILFVITYLTNIDYIYRLPNDNYLLMVLRKDGSPIHSVHFKTRKQVEIQDILLSGMISAINSVFKEVFKKEASVRNINSRGINILLEPGENILAVIITDNVSYFLDQGLKRYVITFEQTFANELKKKEENLKVYESAIALLNSIFPFFIVDYEATKK
jgi:hypothetical protein